MYIPAHFQADSAATRALLTAPAAANLVTMTGQGMLATLLPLRYDPSVGEHGALHGHLARNNVRQLTDFHEAGSEKPWSVDDAPERFIAGQLRAIVGIEVVISRIEAKTKLSQNRSAEDAAGVVAGLRADGKIAGADDVERALRERPTAG